ncbi:hypothetical protein SAMD00019534_026710 [Acytostelium subglobosum LB1]|uniref:hypothetical protein n=1 Tax=Acytostelium subglobosum LB1 TaxID=1410327 RepID=UPI00064495D4|nr:hypothetical protein SAMD00019534_026710 [Acytostelium subglobosum LB1]GAM19496.1 hypothetical protein SAMD00019534_026710 [Acytostelium subglobosum LB1]|eukprot:XP_012757423.1 hypothetical protein SAMD00019534_026710 [Acytostelium subglobosum LB1]
MPLDFKSLPRSILTHGNIEMLQTYLTATNNRMLPIDTLSHLHLAVDSGNVEFVRLLLQHIPFKDDDGNDCRETIDQLFFGVIKLRRGVSVAMLKVLHEEFNCLFTFDIIWNACLYRSTKCNMLSSVQYIVDNMPTTVNLEWDGLAECRIRCALNGSVEIFKLLTESAIFTDESLNPWRRDDFGDILSVAKDAGHEAFVKHFRPNEGEELPEAKPFMSQLAVIRNNDWVNLESLINSDGMNVELDTKTCRRMSESMARFITSGRTARRPKFFGSSVLNMVKAVGKPGSNITAEIVCQFIVNCDHNRPKFGHRAMRCAAGYSAQVMQLLNKHLGVRYDAEFIIQSMRNQCRETMALLFQHIVDPGDFDNLVDIKNGAHHLIHKGSLDDIILMLDNLDLVRRDPKICEWAAINPNPMVFEHIVNMFKLEKLDKSIVKAVFDRALTHDSPQAIKILQQRFISSGKPVPAPKPILQTLHEMAENNAYHSLEFYFNSDTFAINSLPRDQLRTFHSIRDVAYHIGATHVIKLCTDHINSINQQSRQQDTILKSDTRLATCHPGMETAFRSVIGDNKLGKKIMDQIGIVHRSLGIDPEYIIKGAKLLDNHCLEDYLKFDATEWFLKSYTDSSFANIVHNNTSLLEEAFTKCNARAVDVLLANPNMTLDGHSASLSFVWNVSECTHPDWERLLDQYLKITCQAACPEPDKDVLAIIRHPSFLRRLIQSGATLTQIYDQNNSVERMSKGWLTKPWAVEMLQELLKHDLLRPDCQAALLLKAIELNLILIVKHFIDTGLVTELLSLDDINSITLESQSLIEHCCQHGQVACMDLMLPLVTLPGAMGPAIDLGDCFKCATKYGHLEIVKKIHSMIKSSGATHALDSIGYALSRGHLDVVNFILNVIPKDQNKRCSISTIHHSILSVDLLKRLMAHSNLDCGFEMVLSSAVQAGDKTVIDLLNFTFINHEDALNNAVAIFDLDTIRRIIKGPKQKANLSRNHMCTLLEHMAAPGCKLSEKEFIELVRPHLTKTTITKMLDVASSISLSLFKFVQNNFTKDIVLGSNNFREWIDNSVERCDIESIGYLLKLAEIAFKEEEKKFSLGNIITLEKCNTTIIEYLLDNGYIDVGDDDTGPNNALVQLVDMACIDGNLDFIRLIHQRCTTPTQLRRYIPSFDNQTRLLEWFNCSTLLFIILAMKDTSRL